MFILHMKTRHTDPNPRSNEALASGHCPLPLDPAGFTTKPSPLWGNRELEVGSNYALENDLGLWDQAS